MKTLVLISTILLLMSTAFAEDVPDAEHQINGPSNMQELYIAINDSSILSQNNSEYAIHESIKVNSVFSISSSVDIDQEVFIIFDKNLIITDTTIFGNENCALHMLGDIAILNTSFENICVQLAPPIIYEDDFDRRFRDTTNDFTGCEFDNSEVRVLNSVNIMFHSSQFINSEIDIHNFDINGVNRTYKITIESCSFINKDNEYSVSNAWSPTAIYNSMFVNGGIYVYHRSLTLEK